MADEPVPGVSPRKKKRIDQLSVVELKQEIEAGRYSRFNERARAYILQRLVELESVISGDVETKRQTLRDRISVTGVILTALGIVVAVILAIFFA